MAEYRSPGVYVEEVPSAIKAIAGVSTSTVGFIGIYSAPARKTVPVTNESVGTGDGTTKSFVLKNYPVNAKAGAFVVKVDDQEATGVTLSDDDTTGKSAVMFAPTTAAPGPNARIAVTYEYYATRKIVKEALGPVDGRDSFDLKYYPVKKTSLKVTVDDAEQQQVTLTEDDNKRRSTVKLSAPPAKGKAVYATYEYFEPAVPAGAPILCTNFTEFKKSFGDFSMDINRRYLAHAVYGFFNNGGSRCYVSWVPDNKGLDSALKAFAAIDEIALVAAPGQTDDAVRDMLVSHCTALEGRYYRFAILDGPDKASELDKLTKIPSNSGGVMPKTTNYAAWYFPWIKVFDPITKAEKPEGDGLLPVPPSGHLAGIYARVDSARGVHKAPANEPILGALDVSQPLSKAQQDGLNIQGVNCIRVLNNNILVWGARTVGGDANADVKYINVRRTLLFLRKSIDQGTQWVVFEPNTPALWQKITRNVTAFLTNVWRSGALFGNTAQEAFYVKCDKETNPPELRELGQVVTEIGVAIARPAEFVIFRLSQFTAPG
jgi:phage tail sheath protein FI